MPITDNEITEYCENMEHGVILCIGSGKQLKTGTMFAIGDQVQNFKDRASLFYRYPVDNTKQLRAIFPDISKPDLIHKLGNSTPNDSKIYFDDLSQELQARGSGLNTEITKFQPKISHKRIIEFGTVQNTANTDIAFFRDQDLIMMHKWTHPTAISFERQEFARDCMIGNKKIIEAYNWLKGHGQNINPLYLSWVPRWHRILILIPPEWYGRRHTHALRYATDGVIGI